MRVHHLGFVVRNLWHLMRVEQVPTRSVNDQLTLDGLQGFELGTVFQMYETFTNGTVLAKSVSLLLRCVGSRACVVLREQEETVAGFSLYYLNERDWREDRTNTIHEGFTGLAEHCRGRGLGTRLRKHALQHFARAGFTQVSSRISIDNIGSLESNKKLGFDIVDRYYDFRLGEERYYLVCDLNHYQHGTLR